MNADLDHNLNLSPRRGRRIAASVVGVLGTFTFVVGVLGFLILSYVGSSASASSTVRAALASDDVRRAVAEELVDKLQEGGDNGVKIIIFVARSKVVDAVMTSLSDTRLSEVAGDAAAAAYDVFVDGKPRATVDIQYFASAAVKAMRSIDPLIPNGEFPQLKPIVITRSDGTPDLGAVLAWTRIITWLLLVGGLVLAVISWSLSVAGKWIRLRRFGIRLAFGGVGLVALAYLARTASIGTDRESHIADELVSFATDRLLQWSFTLVAVGAVAAVVGAIMNRRAPLGGTASPILPASPA
jgi:hypothetical protein